MCAPDSREYSLVLSWQVDLFGGSTGGPVFSFFILEAI